VILRVFVARAHGTWLAMHEGKPGDTPMKFRSLSTLFLIVAPAALAACGDAAPSDSLATDPTSESESNLAEAAQARRPHPPGPLPLVDVALREVELTASQRELLRGLAVSAQTSRDAAQVGSRNIERKLAAALREASLDAAVVQAEIEALSSQHRTAQRDHAHALYVLHATLTPVQRETVVLAVRRHAPPRGDVEGGLQARGGPPPEGAMPAPEGAMRDPFADSNLTEAQASALEAKLGARPDPNDRHAEHEKRRARMDALLEGFASDDFEPAKFLGETTDSDPHREHLERQLRLTQVALEVLSDTQRETLAVHMTQRPGPHAREQPRGGQ
jgi:Spy/CpxP family protein refolding chaperone